MRLLHSHEVEFMQSRMEISKEQLPSYVNRSD